MKQSVFLLGTLVLASSSCILSLDGDGWNEWNELHHELDERSPTPASVAQENRAKLERLQPGMTVEAVHAALGQETYRSGDKAVIANPHRRESFPLEAGARGDVLFYYTETFKADGLITEDELTPVWFENGMLVGWGRHAFDSWKQRVLATD